MSVPGDAEAGMISPGREPANNQSGFVGGVQFVLVSATMPRGLEKTLGAYVPVSFLSFSSSFCSGVQMNCRFPCRPAESNRSACSSPRAVNARAWVGSLPNCNRLQIFFPPPATPYPSPFFSSYNRLCLTG